MKWNQFLTLAMGAALSLASCSNDDYYGGASGNEVQLTVDIRKPGFMDETRTALFESSTKIGDLDCVWTENDQVIVVNNGARVGILKLMPGYEGQETGRFDGSITGLSDGNHSLTFYYLGTGKDAVGASGEQDYKFDTQAGTLASLSAKDLLISETPVTVSIDGKTGYTDDMALARQFSFAHFRLVLPSGVSAAGQTVTVSGTNVMNEAILNYSKPLTHKAGDINVTVLANNDFYMTLLPQSAVSPTFTVTVSGKTYKGELAQKDIDKNIFINEILSDVSMTRGWPVTMTEVETETPDFPTDPDYGDDYANEDTRNPLHKFAKYNLVRVGERGSLENGFADSETENGALYQWGRNYGFNDSKGIYEGTAYESLVGNGFSQWLDAFGEISYFWDEYRSHPDYYIYNPTNNAVVCGTGAHFNNGYYWADAPQTYSNVDELKELTTKYVMDGNPVGATDDYWINNFGNGGSTWSLRSNACGYDKSDPCPDGWRMPTEAEMRSILPSDNKEVTRQSLTQILNSIGTQQRTSSDGYNYVIKWSNEGNALKIMALVTEGKLSNSEVRNIDWSSKEVVTRYFPFTGFIDNVTGCNIYVEAGYDGRGYYALPYHRNRTVDEGNWMVSIGHDGLTYPTYEYVKILPGDNYGFCIGCYWVSDGKRALKFSNRQSFEKTSYILIENGNPVMGYAIRPVMDKK